MNTPRKSLKNPAQGLQNPAERSFSDPGNDKSKKRFVDDDDDDFDDDIDGGLNDFDKFDDLDVDNDEEDY